MKLDRVDIFGGIMISLFIGLSLAMLTCFILWDLIGNGYWFFFVAFLLVSMITAIIILIYIKDVLEDNNE